MVICVHGRLSHSYKTEAGRKRRTTPMETLELRPSHPRRLAKTRPLPQTREMLFRTRRNRLSWGHSWQRQTEDGPTKAKRRRGLANTQKPHGCSFLPQVHWLLPILRPELLQNRPTTPRPDQEKPSMALGGSPVQSLR